MEKRLSRERFIRKLRKGILEVPYEDYLVLDDLSKQSQEALNRKFWELLWSGRNRAIGLINLSANIERYLAA